MIIIVDQKFELTEIHHIGLPGSRAVLRCSRAVNLRSQLTA
eukprot:SAG25_NODE_12276_length_283_cov_1.114130_1_plen_40_part_10